MPSFDSPAGTTGTTTSTSNTTGDTTITAAAADDSSAKPPAITDAKTTAAAAGGLDFGAHPAACSTSSGGFSFGGPQSLPFKTPTNTTTSVAPAATEDSYVFGLAAPPAGFTFNFEAPPPAPPSTIPGFPATLSTQLQVNPGQMGGENRNSPSKSGGYKKRRKI